MNRKRPPSSELPRSPDPEHWNRPPVPQTINNLRFMNTEIDYTFSQRHPRYCSGVLSNWVPVVRVFGCTKEGNSVCAHIHGFLPYLYCDLPAQKHVDLVQIQEKIESHLAEKTGYIRRYDEQKRKTVYMKHGFSKNENFVHSLQIEKAQSVYGFSKEATNKLKITLIRPQHVPTVRTLIEKGELPVPPIVYECNIEFVIRFMSDQKIGGFSWVEIPKNQYAIVHGPSKTSSCQIEIHANYRQIRPIQIDEIAPIRILSFDIECKADKGCFPDPTKPTDYVIQIANCVTVYGNSEPIIKNVFCYGTSSPIDTGEILECETEVDVMKDWKDFVCECDPDVITVSCCLISGILGAIRATFSKKLSTFMVPFIKLQSLQHGTTLFFV